MIISKKQIDWIKTILWLILAAVISGIIGHVTGLDDGILGFILGFITMTWCLDRYKLFN